MAFRYYGILYDVMWPFAKNYPKTEKFSVHWFAIDHRQDRKIMSPDQSRELVADPECKPRVSHMSEILTGAQWGHSVLFDDLLFNQTNKNFFEGLLHIIKLN